MVNKDGTKKCTISKNSFARVHKYFIGSTLWPHFGDDTLVVPGFADRVLNQNLLVDREGLEKSTALVLPLLHK